VYTIGMQKKWDNLLNTGNIPVIETDRGGQVTYHGLGQLIIYVLIDMKRQNYGVKDLVYRLEQAVIEYLMSVNVKAHRRPKSPGIYVDQCKISALGLRMRRRCIYHGLSLNVDMDLSPFTGIYPCGDKNTKVTQLRDVGVNKTVTEVAFQLMPYLLHHLSYSETSDIEG
jgi:lipoyl(octanoyl) transferase